MARSYRYERMKVCSGERKRINICTVRASHVRVFESREAARENRVLPI